MLGLNTPRGDVAAGESGLSALPDREPDARVTIDQAVRYAYKIFSPNIHVMAGGAAGQGAPPMKHFAKIYAMRVRLRHSTTKPS